MNIKICTVLLFVTCALGSTEQAEHVIHSVSATSFQRPYFDSDAPGPLQGWSVLPRNADPFRPGLADSPPPKSAQDTTIETQ